MEELLVPEEDINGPRPRYYTTTTTIHMLRNIMDLCEYQVVVPTYSELETRLKDIHSYCENIIEGMTTHK